MIETVRRLRELSPLYESAKNWRPVSKAGE